MKKYRIIVAGSRGCTNYSFVYRTLNRLLGRTIPGTPSRRDIEIVSGTADGADKLGERWARDNQIKCTRMPAKWRRPEGGIDFMAGKKRNIEMAKYATHLIAFWDGSSPGTKHMIQEAEKRGLKTRIYRYE